MGAGTRVPAVQDLLTSAVKTELSKNLNTDEAAVLGAAYKAADLSNGFKVKKFITKDAVLFPIQVCDVLEFFGISLNINVTYIKTKICTSRMKMVLIL